MVVTSSANVVKIITLCTQVKISAAFVLSILLVISLKHHIDGVT